MENYREGLVTCAKEDRISNLPEHLIDLILERLPVEEAVRRSILSKKWRYTWTKMRALVFDKDFSDKFAKNGAFGRNGFIRIINHVLFLHNGPILKFHLHLPCISLDGFHDVDLWMLHLSRNGVTEFVLFNLNRPYELPSYYLFSCLQLTKLLLDNCCFKPPLESKGFLNLEVLTLRHIDFVCGTQITLPQLKNMRLYECTNVHNFNVKATKLQSLAVYSCPDAMLLRLLDSPCLTFVAILLWEPVQDFVQVEKINLATLLSNMPKISCLFVDSFFLKFLAAAEKIPKLLPCAITSLNELHLLNLDLGDLDQLDGALGLLRNSPNLEQLFIVIYSAMEPPVDEGPALNHLESPNCFDLTLNRLQTVEIECFKGARLELLFIKLLHAHSPSLEKFTITPSETLGVKEVVGIEKDVMRFPRASPKAEVIYNVAN